MTRQVPMRRTVAKALPLALLVTVAMLSAAEEPFIAGNSVVITSLDEFTDAYQSTILVLGIVDRAKGAAAAGMVGFYHWADGTYELSYWAKPYYTPPDKQDRTNVLVRIDRLEAERSTGRWNEKRAAISVEITKDDFVRMIDLIGTATRLIYRIHGSDTLTVEIPNEIGDLVDEFRRRLEARGGHALSARSSLRPRPEVSATFGGGSGSRSAACCRYCTTGKPCGNSCIARSLTCHKGAGCACAG